MSLFLESKTGLWCFLIKRCFKNVGRQNIIIGKEWAVCVFRRLLDNRNMLMKAVRVYVVEWKVIIFFSTYTCA